jgi:hypothetical protein
MSTESCARGCLITIGADHTRASDLAFRIHPSSGSPNGLIGISFLEAIASRGRRFWVGCITSIDWKKWRE